MKPSLQPGITHTFKFKVPESKTVPALYPEAEEFQQMPHVLATGFYVGLLEWACIQAINPHIDWPDEQTVGIHINVSHTAATPPGMEVEVHVKLAEVDGRRLVFKVEASDGVDSIGKGTHERFVINADRFNAKVTEKAKKANPGADDAKQNNFSALLEASQKYKTCGT
jgi:fluoroacetyl-CoA thioesterase